ncbi:MAG: hypothetical protein NZ519_13115, partial [Bacteroidia bacterium]|nr:hypothetical protein [Bacteroidia bacterium]
SEVPKRSVVRNAPTLAQQGARPKNQKLYSKKEVPQRRVSPFVFATYTLTAKLLLPNRKKYYICTYIRS